MLASQPTEGATALAAAVGSHGILIVGGRRTTQQEILRRRGHCWVHLVDLDLAFGRGENSELLARVIRETPVRVELSGGITSRAAIEAGLAMGPERVNVATQALARIDDVCEAVDSFGERVAVCLDVRGDRLAARGGCGEGGDVWEVLRVLNEAGVARVVVTDVTRDGQMTGSNRELLERVADSTDARIIASGGVNSLADIEALRALGIEGAIVGKALYQGAFTLADALAVAGCEED